MLAVDLSNYSSRLTPANLQAIKSAGVGLVICQALDPPPDYPAGVTRQQIEACLTAGLAVDAYVWQWFDLDVADIDRKLGLLSGLPIRQIWLDVEDTAASKYSVAALEAKVAEALAWCDAWPTTSGQRTGIYSGRWFWIDPRYMGNTTKFADRELWDSNYDDVPDAAVGFRPYGGWQSARIKQFRGTSSLGGISGLDLNVLSVAEEGELTAPEPQPDPEPTNPCAALIGAVAYLGDDVGDRVKQNETLVDAEFKAKRMNRAKLGGIRNNLNGIAAELARVRLEQVGPRPPH